MKRFINLGALILLLLVVLLIAMPKANQVNAAEFAVGYVNTDGYSYGADGYWYWSGIPYSRYWTAGTAASYGYYNGCRVCYAGTAGYWTYVRYYPPAAAKAIDYSADDAEKQIFAFAEAQAKRESEFAKKRASQVYHLQLADALGLKRPNGTLSYSAPYEGLYAGAYSIGGLAVVPSNTLYGAQSYSLKQTVSTNDPAFDINAALQITGQAANLVQSSSEKANGLLNQNIDRAIEKQAALKEQQAAYAAKLSQIETDALAFQTRINALREPKTTVTTTATTTNTGTQAGTQQQEPPKLMQKITDEPTLLSVMQTKCASCHSGKNAQGGLDLAQLSARYAADPSYKLKVFDRVRSDAPPAKRMPRKSDNSPAEPLSMREAALFLNN